MQGSREVKSSSPSFLLATHLLWLQQACPSSGLTFRPDCKTFQGLQTLRRSSRDCEGGFRRLPTSGGAVGLARLYPPSPLRQECRRLQEPTAGCWPLQLPAAVLPPLSCSCSCAGGFSCICRVCAGATAVAASPAPQSCILRT